jgi:hypothetical protein
MDGPGGKRIPHRRHTVHLLATALHACQTVTAERQVATGSNDIPASAPLLERIDPRGIVVTADAMHTQRAHAEHVIAGGGHYLLWSGKTRGCRASTRGTCLGIGSRRGPAPPGPGTTAARSAG